MEASEALRQTIGKVLGRIPSGVFVLTVKHEGRATAMLASWVQQAAFAPPAVSVALAKGRSVAEMIRASDRFALSIIAKEDTALMRRYARGVKENEDAFAGTRTLDGAAVGIPVLADALGYLECDVLSTCDFGGDHELFIGEVIGGAILREGQSFSHLRGNGFHY